MPLDDVIAHLTTVLTAEQLSTTAADREQHQRDQSAHTAHAPDLVVWPHTTADVSHILAVAHQHRIPVVGWGAGSSLEGNTIPTAGGIVVNFQRMDAILELHAHDFQVTVQPGLFYKDMNAQLARHGLFFPPDPGANASIGGMIANNAAGSRTVKYGATRDNVLALEVVLADGQIIRTGSRAVKQSAGYDLTHLIVGSEGTLGLVTAATLKLAPVPAHVSAGTAAFPSVQHAADAVFGIIGAGLGPAALELLDGDTIRYLNADADFDLPETPNLFMEFSGPGAAGLESDLALVEEICRESGATTFSAGMGREARRKLWEGRHRIFEIMVRTFPTCTWRLTDVAVPISAYPQLVTEAAEQMRARGLQGGLVGHAGDGNLHTAVFFPPDDEAATAAADGLNDSLVATALKLGGTCTGEHGVGIGKRKYLVDEHGPAAVALMRRIKQTLDPHNILNPGKLLPPE